MVKLEIEKMIRIGQPGCVGGRCLVRRKVAWRLSGVRKHDEQEELPALSDESCSH